jgi:hypothetical protein
MPHDTRLDVRDVIGRPTPESGCARSMLRRTGSRFGPAETVALHLRGGATLERMPGPMDPP